MIKYKVYVVKTDKSNIVTFQVADFCIDLCFDTIEEACDAIEHNGDDFVHYTILPDVYMK